MKKKIILWMLVLLILVEGVLGLGLRPAKTVIDFMPGLEQEFGFWVVNNDGIDFEVKVYVEGELGEYVEIKEKELIFKEDDDSKKVNFKVKLPEKLPSGEVKASVVVEEILGGGGNPYEFSAKLVLKHKLIVKSPYPEKFVEGKLGFEDKGDKVGLVAEVKNLGSKMIESIKTRFYVNDRREKIDAVESREERLGAGESKVLKAEISKKKVEYGEFDILAAVFYDSYKLELEKKLIIGEPEIEILYFDKYFIAGKINKFAVDLLNKWNRKIENVFVDIFVFKNGKQVDRIRTASFALEGKERKKVEGYFDANKEMGEYEFEVVVDYEGRKAHKKFKGSILKEEEYEKVKEREKESPVLTYILIGVLFGLVLIIFGVLVWYKREYRERREEEREERKLKKEKISEEEGLEIKKREEIREKVIEEKENKKKSWGGNVFDQIKR